MRSPALFLGATMSLDHRWDCIIIVPWSGMISDTQKENEQGLFFAQSRRVWWFDLDLIKRRAIELQQAESAGVNGSTVASTRPNGHRDFLIHIDELVGAKQYLEVSFPGTQPAAH